MNRQNLLFVILKSLAEASQANSAICHTERSEVSKNTSASSANAYVQSPLDISPTLDMTKSVDSQNPLDISVCAKPQYDKVNAGHNVSPPSLASNNFTSSPSLANEGNAI